jgi:hypothetical protein
MRKMLTKITTLVQFKETYWFDTESTEDAKAMLKWRDSGEVPHFDDSAQEFIGEVVIGAEVMSEQDFNNWVKEGRINGTVYARDENLGMLIQQVPSKSPVIASMVDSLLAGTPKVTDEQ